MVAAVDGLLSYGTGVALFANRLSVLFEDVTARDAKHAGQAMAAITVAGQNKERADILMGMKVTLHFRVFLTVPSERRTKRMGPKS